MIWHFPHHLQANNIKQQYKIGFMIDAKELNSDNRVIYRGEIYEVTMVDSSADEVNLYNGDHALGVNIEFIEPIPLSPEILKAAGFEKIYDGGDNYADEYLLNDVQLRVAEDIILFKFYKGAMTETSIILESLHQLQNLYYSLTTKELVFNPSL